MPTPLDDPLDLSPDHRRRELAVLLAQGMLRLLHGGGLPGVLASGNAAEHAAETPHKDLEVSEPARLPVASG